MQESLQVSDDGAVSQREQQDTAPEIAKLEARVAQLEAGVLESEEAKKVLARLREQWKAFGDALGAVGELKGGIDEMMAGGTRS